MKKVCLLSLEQAAVIVLQSGGIQYWNKTGHSDERFQAEGILVPISNDPPADQPELSLSSRLQAVTGTAETLTPPMARAINELLYEVSSSDELSVDATRISASSHSWVHVVIRPQGEFSYFRGFVGEEPYNGSGPGDASKLQGVEPQNTKLQGTKLQSMTPQSMTRPGIRPEPAMAKTTLQAVLTWPCRG